MPSNRIAILLVVTVLLGVSFLLQFPSLRSKASAAGDLQGLVMQSLTTGETGTRVEQLNILLNEVLALSVRGSKLPGFLTGATAFGIVHRLVKKEIDVFLLRLVVALELVKLQYTNPEQLNIVAGIPDIMQEASGSGVIELSRQLKLVLDKSFGDSESSGGNPLKGLIKEKFTASAKQTVDELLPKLIVALRIVQDKTMLTRVVEQSRDLEPLVRYSGLTLPF